jgi:ribosome-binding factor A
VDPLPERLLNRLGEEDEVEFNETNERSDMKVKRADHEGEFTTDIDSDGNTDNEIDSDEEREILKKQGMVPNSKGVYVGATDSEGEQDDGEYEARAREAIVRISSQESNAKVSNQQKWEHNYIPEDQTDFKYATEDDRNFDTEVSDSEVDEVKDEGLEAANEDIYGSDDGEQPSSNEEECVDHNEEGLDTDEEIAAYAANPFSHLDEVEPRREEETRESKYSARLKRQSQNKKMRGLEELDPYDDSKRVGGTKLQRLLAAAKRKKLAAEHGKNLKEPRPRDGKAPHKRQLTLAVLFESHLDEILSKGIVTNVGRNIFDDINIVEVCMSGDLQIIKVYWRLMEGGSKYIPQEFHYSDDSAVRRKEIKKDRPERRDKARKYLESLKNEKEREYEALFETHNKRIRFEMGRRVTMKRLPHLIFELDMEGKKQDYLRSVLLREVQRGEMPNELLKTSFYQNKSGDF